MNQMIVDANELILGRLATQVAKKLMLGEEVQIINCEKAVISGTKKHLMDKYIHKRERGEPAHGPHFPKRSDMFIKRTIRGMLPYKTTRGDTAFKRLKCFVGTPDDLKDAKAETIALANVDKLPSLKFVSVGTISKLLGAKQ